MEPKIIDQIQQRFNHQFTVCYSSITKDVNDSFNQIFNTIKRHVDQLEESLKREILDAESILYQRNSHADSFPSSIKVENNDEYQNKDKRFHQTIVQQNCGDGENPFYQNVVILPSSTVIEERKFDSNGNVSGFQENIAIPEWTKPEPFIINEEASNIQENTTFPQWTKPEPSFQHDGTTHFENNISMEAKPRNKYTRKYVVNNQNSGEKKEKCSQCEFSCNRKWSLNRHINNIHSR